MTTGVTDVAGDTDVTNITGSTVRHMACDSNHTIYFGQPYLKLEGEGFQRHITEKIRERSLFMAGCGNGVKSGGGPLKVF